MVEKRVPAHPPWQSVEMVSAKRAASQLGIRNRVSTLFVAQFGNVDASLGMKRSKMGSQCVDVVAIVSVDDAAVPVVEVVEVAVVLVVTVVSVLLVPVALAPVDDTPVSTAAVSVLALLSFLQPAAHTIAHSRTATNNFFMRRNSKKG